MAEDSAKRRAPVRPNGRRRFGFVRIAKPRIRLSLGAITLPELWEEVSARGVDKFREVGHLKEKATVVEKTKMVVTLLTRSTESIHDAEVIDTEPWKMVGERS